MHLRDYCHIPKRDRTALLLVVLVSLLAIGLHVSHSNEVSSIEPEKLHVYQAQLDSLASNTVAPYTTKLTTRETICINTADAAQLKKIPGIGDVHALRIVQYRDSIGKYKTTEQLKEVKGIKTKLYNKIAPYITID